MRALLIAIPFLAIAQPVLAQPRVGEVIGVDKTLVQARLAAEGYRLTDIEVEDGRLEIKALKDKTRIEIDADPRTGKVLKVEVRRAKEDRS